MRNIEASIQKALVHWCKTHECSVLHNIFHVPNGGLRDAITARHLKDQGVLAGVPDLCLPLPGGVTLWIELKPMTGKLSTKQEALHEKWRAMGHWVVVAYGYIAAQEIFKEVVEKYGKVVNENNQIQS